MGIDLSRYDFVDFGSGHGGCIQFALKKLGGKSGLGFDLLEHRAKTLSENGYPCMHDDITKITLPKKSVKFVTMSHCLEHLNSLIDVTHVVKLGIRTAMDFVFIEGPSFDFDGYLKNLGLKFFWFDKCGHKVRVTTKYLIDICEKEKLDFDLLVQVPSVKSSNSDVIFPFTAITPEEEIYYDPARHPTKSIVSFSPQLYKSFILFIWIHSGVNKRLLLRSRKNFVKIGGRTNGK